MPVSASLSRVFIFVLLALAGCGGKAAPRAEPPRAEAPAVPAPVKAADARAAEGEAREHCMPIPADPPEAPPKLDVAQAIVSEGLLYIHLDPRASGVVVPEKHAKKPRLVLAVGDGLSLPIPDLNIDASGISGTLSFNHAPFFSKVPWSAVYALVSPDGRGMVWYKDVPPELRCPPGVEPPAN